MMTLEQFIGEDNSNSGSEKPSDAEDSDYGGESDEDIDYGIEDDSDDDSDSDDDYDDEDDSGYSGSSGYSDGEDREYTGDMFGKNKPVKFSAGTS